MNHSADHKPCPEKQLLIHCARTTVPLPVREKIRDLSAGPLDWEFVFSQASENSVTPLLGRQLFACAPDVLASAVTERLKTLVRAAAARSLILTAELLRVMAIFRTEDIPVVPYKGPVLAAQAYGDVALREFEDLDLVLRQRHMAKANSVLTALGFRPKYSWVLSPGTSSSLVPGEYHYRDEARRLALELHTEITLRHFPVAPGLDALMQRLEPVPLSGHEVPTFAPADMLPILCVHGAKDFWERISWIADISEFVRAYPRLDWDGVFRSAEVLKAQRMLCLGLALAVGLVDTPLPKEIATRVKSDSVAAAIAAELKSSHLNHSRPRRSGLDLLRFRRRMMPGNLAGWRYAARLSLVPAEEDWLMLRLPRPLAPAYMALRPIRLLRKYGLAGGRDARPSS